MVNEKVVWRCSLLKRLVAVNERLVDKFFYIKNKYIYFIVKMQH